MGNSKVIFGGTVLIDLTNDTVAAEYMLSGYTAHGADGELITGACTFDADTSEDTATAAEILLSKTAHARGLSLVGTMPNNGAVSAFISAISTPYTVPQGYHDGSGTVSIYATEADKIIPGNIKAGVEILGVTGSYAGESISAQTKSVTPSVSAFTVLPDQGYDYLAQVNVASIPFVSALNAAGGYTITIG